ncbi:SEC-C metal-binding domain-containing protein [Oleiagrimonas sp.]|jgi:hypothetical protein|uniref:YecA family protein n=1 Tax=Oleiagrimonas sp. TaxID=2010330 RepID=UPI0026201B56|nr:SEC-C metal-binding domain-containing protein [Oleiagrimonas sp.]MDA3913859.1 SEC-C metal-binding domain-containing protein [Oleiagrimonas sp.]
MMDSPVGPDEACHCGSGRAYRRCCIQRDLQEMVQQQNQAAHDDFHGLSPVQMHALLYAPFDSPRWLEFPAVLPETPDAPIAQLFEQLCQALDAGELKATSKGNLPRAFCQEVHRAFVGSSPYSMDRPVGKVSSEEDFEALYVTRLVAQQAGLLRKYKGRFILSRACKSLRDAHGMQAVYPALLKACARRFNWGYSDGYPEYPIIQHAFAFSLYLLSRYGDTPRPRQFYEDAFLRAFPMLVDEAEGDAWTSGEAKARRCYSLRTLVRFAGFMGLARLSAELYRATGDKGMVSKTPLLDQVVCFHLQTGQG